MAKAAQSVDARFKESFGTRLRKDMLHNWQIYLMWLPVLVFYLIFKYAPMGGLIIAFEKYKPAKGILRSQWVGLKYFEDFLTGPYAWRTIRNTLIISLLQIIVGFPLPIIFALLINEVKHNSYKRVVQTVSYMPHFISLVVLCGMISDFSASTGFFNVFRDLAGQPHINFLGSNKYYRTIYVGSYVWKHMGWGSILYLATLSNIDQSLYEAAAIDGAGRFQRMWHVTMPALVPIIAVQLIMRMGHVMGEGHQKTILLYNESIYEVSDIVSSYVYRRGLKQNDYSYGAAVGMFNSVVNVIIVCSANYFSKHVVKESLW
ncbi:MAG: sugar ABC transporter permease [Clostridia bacterium]|nr:sugar ABC transporter permease [Clostridia bacterium]MBR5384121.1 sugar ABC transporter permease [Clostridia bacterium]